MLKSNLTRVRGIKRSHVKEMVIFALNYLPQLDERTLTQFLKVVEADDNLTHITARELSNKMKLMLQHDSQACPYSLETLAELLDVQFQKPRATARLLHLGIFAGENTTKKFVPIGAY